MSNYSSDLFWELTRNNSSYLVKRGHGTSKVQFSKDPLNLTNKHSRKQSGLVNDKAIGVQLGSKGGVAVITKTNGTKNGSNPTKLFNTTEFKQSKSQRKVYQAVANLTSKNGYRPDLRADAVGRASAILYSQKAKKDKREAKPRGAKAQKAEGEQP